MSLVKGENVALLFYDDGQWKAWACARSGSFNITTDFIETSARGTGNFTTRKPTKISWNVSIEGLISLGVTDLTLADLQQRQLEQTLLLVKWTQTAIDGTAYNKQGYAYISSSSDTGSFDNVATFTIELLGTGPITQDFIPTPIQTSDVTRYEYTGIGGEYFFESANLYNKDVLFVDKDGIGRASLITMGTPDPATKEVLYEADIGSGQGRLTFAQPFEANEKCVYLVQNL